MYADCRHPQNLAEEVKKGQFREDPLFPDHGASIELPPLRERGNDILLLAKHFVDEFAKENKLGCGAVWAKEAKEITSISFPGNIRELKAIVTSQR